MFRSGGGSKDRSEVAYEEKRVERRQVYMSSSYQVDQWGKRMRIIQFEENFRQTDITSRLKNLVL